MAPGSAEGAGRACALLPGCRRAAGVSAPGVGVGGANGPSHSSAPRARTTQGATAALSLSATSLTVTGQIPSDTIAAEWRPRPRRRRHVSQDGAVRHKCSTRATRARVGFNKRHLGHSALDQAPFRRQAAGINPSGITPAALGQSPPRPRRPYGHGTGKAQPSNHEDASP